jgi:DNA-binding NtrC family response regulator
MRHTSEPLPLVGDSPAIRALREEIDYASRCDAKVLITGESGAGKEIVARLIHAGSARSRNLLVTVNCAALTETLLETELFGHVRGSFTGAYRDRAGVFERANGGTVFMDEIGETTPRMQGLLLRFLETGELQRVGSDDRLPFRVNVRVIAATNQALLESVAAKTFREDLYYRLNVIHLQVPPLRERREDIPALLDFFLRDFSRHYGVEQPRVCPAALSVLTQYSWPGNVRELKNVVERTIVRGRSATVEPQHLPIEVQRDRSRHVPVPAPAAAEHVSTAADALFHCMVVEGKCFWDVVYGPFMARDLTRADLRAIVRRGLERTSGNYKGLTELFNVLPQEYKRFLSFLRKHGCQLRFQDFRSPSRFGGERADPEKENRRIEASA